MIVKSAKLPVKSQSRECYLLRRVMSDRTSNQQARLAPTRSRLYMYGCLRGCVREKSSRHPGLAWPVCSIDPLRCAPLLPLMLLLNIRHGAACHASRSMLYATVGRASAKPTPRPRKHARTHARPPRPTVHGCSYIACSPACILGHQRWSGEEQGASHVLMCAHALRAASMR
ncbi:hypothetical protein IE81DRAFT_188810 [Ceraceosorus guamensis]|uniref:Uncharacterized protein n=1 Tax=Ceraceosorus guamensis TaxID=1522189 RepID=A0A316WCU9_9BASI|nr:hypothetical protein IE81DRAFT_188810 [Ceraceosorus guamensis]PWN45355.1 hypothetical protein IE81DRAFT_188810 [Ceraceosorus guamensis]